jgi:hypothetical protein
MKNIEIYISYSEYLKTDTNEAVEMELCSARILI